MSEPSEARPADLARSVLDGLEALDRWGPPPWPFPNQIQQILSLLGELLGSLGMDRSEYQALVDHAWRDWDRSYDVVSEQVAN